MIGKISQLLLILLYCGSLGLLASLSPLQAQEIPKNGEIAALASVARLEVAADFLSLAPDLLPNLSSSPGAAPFEEELLRRLHEGSSGSAFCVAPGYFLTTSHIVLAGAHYSNLAFSREQWESLEATVLAFSKPQITFDSGDGKVSYLGRVVALDRNNDLALLFLPEAVGRVAPLPLAGNEALQISASVTAVGYTDAGLKISRGKIESLIRGEKALEPGQIRSYPGGDKPAIVVGKNEGEVVRIQHSAAIAAGMSGGPVLNSDGQVVGISYGFLKANAAPGEKAQEIFLAVSRNPLEKFLAAKVSLQAVPPLEETASPVLPAAASPPSPPQQLGNATELEDLAFDIRHSRANTAIPNLQLRLRRNRFDFAARALLVQAHLQESLYPSQLGPQLQAAFYQASWLAYFAPELNFANPAKIFIGEQRPRVEPYLSEAGAKNALLAGLAEQTLTSEIAKGHISRLLPQQFSDLAQSAAHWQDRTSNQDAVASASLIRIYLIQEQAWELTDPLMLRPETRNNRKQLLTEALGLAGPLAQQLSLAPGAKRLIAYSYARLSRLEAASANLGLARRHYEEAFNLDPTSPTLAGALAQLEAKP
jgi:S1-C subfamily serine protease